MWRQSTICLFSLNRSRLLAAFADTPSRAAWPANLGAQGSIRKNCERNHKDSDVSDRLSQLSPPHQVLFGTQILRSFPQFQHLHMNKRDSAFNVFERLETSNQTSDLGDFCHRKRTLGRRWKLYTLTGNKAMKVEGVRTLCLKKTRQITQTVLRFESLPAWDSSAAFCWAEACCTWRLVRPHSRKKNMAMLFCCGVTNQTAGSGRKSKDAETSLRFMGFGWRVCGKIHVSNARPSAFCISIRHIYGYIWYTVCVCMYVCM